MDCYAQVNAWVSLIKNVKVSGQCVSKCGSDYQDVCECKKVRGYEDKCRGELMVLAKFK